MSWYNPVTWFFGEDADTHAANVAAQWRLLEKTAKTADPATWQRAYDLMVSSYGPPASTEAQILANARAQYMADIDKAADAGFVEGAGKAVNAIVNGASDAVGSVWDKIPPWIRWSAFGALALAVLSILMRAGFISPRISKQ